MCDHSHDTPVKGERLEDGHDHACHHRDWSRRQFMQGLGMSATGLAMGLSGIPIRSYGASPLLSRLRSSSNDRILVLIQLSGGNDGLNTVVPYTNDTYYQQRPNIAINASSVLNLTPDLGLHPALTSFADMYADGTMEIVQGVGYTDPVLSHFTSTDVWASASDPTDISRSGWLGRYLEEENPNHFDTPTDYPLAIQLGNGSPLVFQGSIAGMGITYPDLDLLNKYFETGVFYNEDFAPDTSYGGELSFVRTIANSAVRYAETITAAATGGTNSVEYPSRNRLSGNLAATARLIRGGLGTSIYHLNLGGFDTHSSQSSPHASLMEQLSGAIGAFVSDLQADGLDQRVLVMTFSEFGRRIYQNGSAGTDHGTSAPLFLFGGGVQGGIIGGHPSLTDLDPGGNMVHGIDFRSVYGSVLNDWFDVSDQEVTDLMGADYAHLSLIDSAFATNTGDLSVPDSISLFGNYPNPFSGSTVIEFALASSEHVSISVYDIQGRQISTLVDQVLPAGRHETVFDGENLPSGTYLARLQTRAGMQSRKLVIVR